MSNGKGSVLLEMSVIIMSMVTLAVGVANFYCFQQWGEAEGRLNQANTNKSYTDGQLNNSNDRIARLVEVLDGKSDSSGAAVKAAEDEYKADMAKFNSTFSQFEDSYATKPMHERPSGVFRNYRQSIRLLLNTLAAAQTDTAEETKQIALLTQRVTDLETVVNDPDPMVGQVAALKTAYDEKKADLDKTHEDLAAHVKDLDALKTEMEGLVRLKGDEVAAANTAAQKKYADQQRSLNSLETNTRRTKQEINSITETTFEVPDGEIKWVNPVTRSVWINLGRADKLQPQIMFSVFGPSSADVGRRERKAAIEITKILDERLAEARIVEDHPNNPILPGDLIFTPAWHPGRQEKMAICGLMDLDGDTLEDREATRSLLRSAGSILECELLPSGEEQGTLSAGIRYVIKGKPPSEQLDKYSKFIDRCRKLGIREIELKDFLDQIGFVNSSDFKEFGPNSNPRDFDNVTRPNEAPGNALNQFRQRQAPARGQSGAYNKK